MVAVAVQFGLGNPHSHASFVGPLLLLAGAGSIGGVLFVALRALRRLILTPIRARRRERADAAAETRARAMMDELCPHGWQAQIILLPHSRSEPGGRVALDWAALEGGHGEVHPATARRVWGETIAEALRAMVADRITDETLAQIEQDAFADGAVWPDLGP
jgi:hypothetical protein